MVIKINFKLPPFNEEIFRLVENGSRVLDVGCGNGELGERLRADKNCFVIGVEINKVRADQAKRKLDEVINSDIELIDDPSSYGSFDAIIFADCLEHLRYPVKALQQLSTNLKANGYFIISLPNVANWTVRLRLLLGKFDYQETGILDKTHLHFFTISSSKKFIRDAGFDVVYVGGYNQILRRLGRAWKGLFARQIIIKVQKRAQYRAL